jgi:hypothetical protein
MDIKAENKSVLKWFSGKALFNAIEAMDLLEASEKQGYWLPKAATKVRAALGKANEAAKIAKKHGKALEAIGDYRTPQNERGWEVAFMLRYSCPARDINFVAIRNRAPEELKAVVDIGEQFYSDIAPLREAMDRLDATRPVPQISYLGASPTVTATMERLGVVANMGTVRVCPMEWIEKEITDKAGKKSWIKVGRLVWPQGTVHNKSRFACKTSNCHACGHAIKTNNWIPLVVDQADGTPVSVWVGRDCAKTLFGVAVSGPVELEA